MCFVMVRVGDGRCCEFCRMVCCGIFRRLDLRVWVIINGFFRDG